MKNLYKLVASLLLAVPTALFAQTPYTATYNFADVTTTSGRTDPTPLPVVANLVFDSVRAVGVTSLNSSGGGRFSFTGHPLGATNGDNNYASLTGSPDLGIYYEVTIGADPGYLFSIDSLKIRLQKSGTGSRTFIVRSSLDGYTTNLPGAIYNANPNLTVEGGNVFFYNDDALTSGQTGAVVLPGTDFENLSGDVTFRVYAYNAEALTGTSSIDDLIFSGNVEADLTSIKSVAKPSFSVYPNPSSNGFVTLDFGKENGAVKEVTVYNVIGNVVEKVVLTDVSRHTFDLSSLNAGTYFVQVVSNGTVLNKKILLNK